MLERNDLTIDNFMKETHKCMLVSIFEVIVDEMNNVNIRKEIKQRYLSSVNKIITTQKIVFEKTRCKLNESESRIIYEYLYAFFAKKNTRIVYDNLIKSKIFDFQSKKCNICNKNVDIINVELDHIIPWRLVGDELGISNLQILCKDCNRRKSKNSAYNLKMFLVNG